MYYRAFLQRRWHAAAAGAVLGIVRSCLEAIGGGSCKNKTVPQRRIAFERREQIYNCCTRGTTLIVALRPLCTISGFALRQTGESLLHDNGQVPAMPTAKSYQHGCSGASDALSAAPSCTNRRLSATEWIWLSPNLCI